MVDSRTSVSFLARFHAAVRRHPEDIAVAHGNQALSYSELSSEALRLACKLRGRGVGTDALVGVSLPASVELAVAVLAVLEAGGAYVPVPPANSTAWQKYVLDNSQPILVIAEGHHATRLSEWGFEVVNSESEQDADKLLSAPSDDGIGYVLYSSDSEEPSGIAMERSALTHLIDWQLSATTLGVSPVTIQFSAMEWRTHFQELFGTWCAGGTLHLLGHPDRQDTKRLIDHIDNYNASRIFLPFTYLQDLAEVAIKTKRFPISLRDIVTDEQLQCTSAIRQLFATLSDCRLHVHYGFDETQVVLAHRLPADPSHWPTLPPIGRVIDGAVAAVLDEDHIEVADGHEGALFIGGDQLACGYVNRPEMANEKFVDWSEALWFDTGDRVSKRADGMFELLARGSSLVKYRGGRVDLGHLERSLTRHATVLDACATVNSSDDQEELIAYVTLVDGATFDEATLRKHLSQSLPGLLIPSHIVAMEYLPRTPHGSIDQRMLANTEDEPRDHSAAIVPAAIDFEVLREGLGAVTPVPERYREAVSIAETHAAPTAVPISEDSRDNTSITEEIGPTTAVSLSEGVGDDASIIEAATAVPAPEDLGNDPSIIEGVGAATVAPVPEHSRDDTISEDALAPETSSPSVRANQVLVVSAETKTALEQATLDLKNWLHERPEANFADVAWTMQVDRTPSHHRRAIVASTALQACQRLNDNVSPARKIDNAPTGVAYLFPGQASKYPGMGLGLAASEPAFREALHRCAELAQPSLGLDLRMVLFANDESAEEVLARTEFAQPSVFAIEYALAETWRSWGVEPTVLVGHGIGEFVAATLAGVFSLEEAVRIVCERAKLIQAMPHGSMLSVELDEASTLERISEDLALACVNAPQQCVITGPTDAIVEFCAIADTDGVSYRPLAISQALHSPMMGPTVEAFETIVRNVTLSKPTLPIVSSITGAQLTDQEATDPGYWAGHLLHTVRFAQAIQNILDRSNEPPIFLEVGPQDALTSLVRLIASDRDKKNVAVASLANVDENNTEPHALLGAVASLWTAGWAVDWHRFHRGTRHQRVPLPTYPVEGHTQAVTSETNDDPAVASEPTTVAASSPNGDAMVASDAPAVPLASNGDFVVTTEATPTLATSAVVGDFTITTEAHEIPTPSTSNGDSAVVPDASEVPTPSTFVDDSPVTPEASEKVDDTAVATEAAETAESVDDTPFATEATESVHDSSVATEATEAAETAESVDNSSVALETFESVDDSPVAPEASESVDNSSVAPEATESVDDSPVAPEASESIDDSSVAPEASESVGDSSVAREALEQPAASALIDESTITPPSLPHTPPTPIDSADTQQDDVLRSLIATQLGVMSQQLAALGFEPSQFPVATPPSASNENVFSSTPTTSSDSTAAEKGKDDATVETQKPKTFGTAAQLRIASHKNKALGDREKAGLAELSRTYTAKTRRSKDLAQTHRARLADPVAISEFRPESKELVYPIVVDRSNGCRLHDVDGNEYVDIMCGFGTNLLGNGVPEVNAAVAEQLKHGYAVGPQHSLAGEVASMIAETTGAERVAFCNTGSEATITAMHIARNATRRNTIVIFDGACHGIFDEGVVRTDGDGQSLQAAVAGSPFDNVVILEYGADKSLEEIRRLGRDVAAVLIEPVQYHRPGLQPREFVRSIRKITKEIGAAMIMDELITGFRVHPGGAQAVFDVQADISTYGSVVSGGIPIGVIAGRSKFMDKIDGGVWQYGDDSAPADGLTHVPGTFAHNPLALAAAKAVLNILMTTGSDLQTRANERTDAFVARMNDFLKQSEVPIYLDNFGTLFKISFSQEVIWGQLIYVSLRSRGVHVWEGRPCFFTTAHENADIAFVEEAFRDSVDELMRLGFLPGKSAQPTSTERQVPDAHDGKTPEHLFVAQ